MGGVPLRLLGPVIPAAAYTGPDGGGALTDAVRDSASVGFPAFLLSADHLPGGLRGFLDDPVGSAYGRLLAAAAAEARARQVVAVAGLPRREPVSGEDPDYTREVYQSQGLAFVDAMGAFAGVAGIAVALDAVPASSLAGLRAFGGYCRRARLLLCGLTSGPTPEPAIPVDILAVRVTSPPAAGVGGSVPQASAGGDRAERGVILDLRALGAGGAGDVWATVAAIRSLGVPHVLLDDYRVIAEPPWGDATIRALVCSALLPLGRRVDVRGLAELPLEKVARLMAYAWWQYKSGRVDGDRLRIEADYIYVLPYARFLREAAAKALAGDRRAEDAIDRFFAQRPEIVRYLWASNTPERD